MMNNPKERSFCFIDQFSSLDDLRPKDRGNDDTVAALLAKVGKFSVFEATEHSSLAKTLMRLEASGRIKIDNSCEYPWVKVTEVDGEPTSLIGR